MTPLNFRDPAVTRCIVGSLTLTAEKDWHQMLRKGDCDVQQAAINAEVEAAAAAVEAELDAQEWNMQEIERIQEEQASAC